MCASCTLKFIQAARMAHANEAWQLVRQHVGEQTALKISEISPDRTSPHSLRQEFVLHVILDDVVTLPEVELADCSACYRYGGARSRPWSWIRFALTCAAHDICFSALSHARLAPPCCSSGPKLHRMRPRARARSARKMGPVLWVFRYRHYTRFSSGSLRIFLTPLGSLLKIADIPPRLLEFALVPQVRGS